MKKLLPDGTWALGSKAGRMGTQNTDSPRGLRRMWQVQFKTVGDFIMWVSEDEDSDSVTDIIRGGSGSWSLN